MFKWLKKIKVKFTSGCCVNVEIDNTDGQLDQVDYESESNTLRIH